MARAVLLIIGLWALANAVWIARNVFFLAVLAALMGLLFSVLSRPIRKAGLSRVPAVILAVVLLLATVGLAGWLLWPAIEADLPEFREAIVSVFGQVAGWLETQITALTGRSAGGMAGDGLRRLASGALPVLTSVAGAVSGAVIALFAGAWLAVSPGTYTEGLIRLAPPAARERLSAALDEVGKTLRQWLLATLANMLVVGVVTTVGLYLLGVPAALPLGVLAGLAEFVPYFGSIGAGALAIAAGFVVSPTHALYVLLLVLALQQVQGNLIGPLVLKHVVRLPPALTVLAQSLMAALFGLLGLLLAVPLLAATLVLVRRLYLPRIEASDA